MVHKKKVFLKFTDSETFQPNKIKHLFGKTTTKILKTMIDMNKESNAGAMLDQAVAMKAHFIRAWMNKVCMIWGSHDQC